MAKKKKTKKVSTENTRSGRGIFDPDYRKRGWNQSKYAPKNGKDNITQSSFKMIVLILLPFFCYAVTAPEDADRETMTQGLMGLVMMAFVAWPMLAIWMRGREWKRLEKLLAEQEAEELQLQSSPTYARQAQYRPTRHGLQTAGDFEHEMAWILNTLSKFEAVVVGGAGDKGVDIELYRHGQLVGVAQCKYYAPNRTIAPGYVRELYGVKHMMNVQVAYLFTTAKASAQTHELAHSMGMKVYDGEKIADMRRKAREKNMDIQRSSQHVSNYQTTYSNDPDARFKPPRR
jgi:hypothetical protein